MLNALKKTGLWFAGNILFGLVTVILIYILNFFKFSPLASGILAIELKHLLKDGIIAFFFCALMGSVLIDILIEKEERKNAGFITKWVPFILLSFLIVVYLMILFGKLDDDYFYKYNKYPIIVDIVSFIYCFAIKVENFTRR